MEGNGSDQLLYPADPRPLAAEEKQAIVLMSSFCPQQSTPDPAVGTALAQGSWHVFFYARVHINVVC